MHALEPMHTSSSAITMAVTGMPGVGVRLVLDLVGDGAGRASDAAGHVDHHPPSGHCRLLGKRVSCDQCLPVRPPGSPWTSARSGDLAHVGRDARVESPDEIDVLRVDVQQCVEVALVAGASLGPTTAAALGCEHLGVHRLRDSGGGGLSAALRGLDLDAVRLEMPRAVDRLARVDLTFGPVRSVRVRFLTLSAGFSGRQKTEFVGILRSCGRICNIRYA